MFNFLKRDPDFIVSQNGIDYLRRWWLIPKNKYLNIYLHKFISSDDTKAMHDHPWSSLGMILWGTYREHMPSDRMKWIKEGKRSEVVKKRYPFQPVYRDANFIHRIELNKDESGNEKPVWTLFLTGQWRRNWGFWCDFGFRPFEEYVSVTDEGNEVGRGCE